MRYSNSSCPISDRPPLTRLFLSLLLDVRKARLFQVFGCISIVLSTIGTISGQSETDVRASELKKHVLSQWKLALNDIESSQWHLRVEYYTAHNDPQQMRLDRVDSIQRIFHREFGWLWRKQIDDVKINEIVSRRWDDAAFTNQEYTATLRKSKDKDRWLLVQLNLNRKPLADLSKQEAICPWMMVGTIPFDRLLGKDEFKIVRIEQSQGAGIPGIVKAHFVYDARSESEFDVIRSGFVEFDSEHHYRPVSYHYNLKSRINDEGAEWGNIVYADSADMPVPKVMTINDKWETKVKGTWFGKTIKTFSNVVYNKTIPSEQLRLTHYGIPEPGAVANSRRSYWYIWFFLIAGVSLAVGGFLMHRVHRRKSLTAHSESSK